MLLDFVLSGEGAPTRVDCAHVLTYGGLVCWEFICYCFECILRNFCLLTIQNLIKIPQIRPCLFCLNIKLFKIQIINYKEIMTMNDGLVTEMGILDKENVLLLARIAEQSKFKLTIIALKLVFTS